VGDDVSAELQALIDLQEFDTRIARLDAEVARLPKQIEQIQQALNEAGRSLGTLKAKVDQTRKDLRLKEKDLEVAAAKRAKTEARLWEVKTNKEYSAVLLEIEEIKQEKASTEEEILALMEMQERLTADLRDAEARMKVREQQAREDEAKVRKKLAEVEGELSVVRAERQSRAREIPASLLSSYERILKARSGVAVTAVGAGQVCGACRVSIRPQAMQELRTSGDLMLCESCGRYLYWQEPA
jgi:predicted  nucleic acid-binding Zn-ribbon protein